MNIKQDAGHGRTENIADAHIRIVHARNISLFVPRHFGKQRIDRRTQDGREGKKTKS